MQHDIPQPSRRRLLTGAAAAAAALIPLGSGLAQAAPHRSRAAAYPDVHWTPAAPANYTAANRPAQYGIDMVIIHVTQETYADTVKIFQNPKRQVSAHYCVRSADGYIGQFVREDDVAWHAGNWNYNTRSIGIEHEGWVDQPKWFTDVMYEQSAQLTAAICARYGIPRDRKHIIGHVEVPGSDHTDPGRFWDWPRYMSLVKAAS
ncbi:N-acetylmuramoyl-L-alanine amidase [Streptomyces violens]|uniref:N-acetylmuramoyl-L-alanine amidase n=1 Tax=Streptomyces violens TaxID=66377 RepID=UPI0004C06854|nr:N-acetylmuramoyl-L-alanine amidase [Streptomyces violens]